MRGLGNSNKKGSGYAGMAMARCPFCWFTFRKSKSQIAAGDTRCIDRDKCQERQRSGKKYTRRSR